MKVSLFLGAGASAMFGKPTTAEFLKVLPQHLTDDMRPFHDYLVNSLEFRDIEYVLQATKDMGSFAQTEIGEWVLPQMPLPNQSHRSGEFLQLSSRLEHQIESIIKSYYTWNHAHNPTLLDVYNQIFSNLRSQTDSVTVFTTNYDTAIEMYCIKSGRTCVDGFVDERGYRTWTGNFDAQNADNPIRLYKLHGSLDWKLHREFGIIQSLEVGNNPNIVKDIMIMPTRSPKEEEKATPFSEIFGLMKTEFQNQDACIVVGYSFRDEGVNAVFEEFIRDKKAMIVISPTVIKDLSNNLFKQECESVSGGLGNLYISPKEGDVAVIGFEAKFESGNAADLISKSLSVLKKVRA